ncbi:glycosyltransferase [Alkalicoccobacillus gibsonii]|uniref:glycosyltransferase n=1 Tax=Alkalicoccobacillus gibsonii TaxID=79881 RepID=UPI001934826A|nr:glycosyltransferase family 2 protein [Alkalicoccobacillus gibsonii]MBM0067716.1 glycosyltransferase family 2 protein [Alkalicoccobacillus gibsonii]
MRNSYTFRVITNKEEYLRRMNGQTPLPASASQVKRNMNYKLHVIVPAMDEADTLPGVLKEIKRLQPDQIIVVVNGSKDHTAHVAESHGAKVINYSQPLGNDVGRAIGALNGEADIYLFTDGDIVIKAEDYLPFIQDVENGIDMAINSIDWITKVDKADIISQSRFFLNAIQERRDLRAENILTIPHAFSRKGLEMIGKSELSNPVLANTIAIDKKLQISVPHTIDVLGMNKMRTNHLPKPGEVIGEAMQRMHGDFIEALDYLIDTYGPTLHYPKPMEGFHLLYSDRLKWQALSKAKEKSVIFYVPNGAELSDIRMLFESNQIEWVPIVSSSHKEAVDLIAHQSIPYMTVDEACSLDIAFYIGSQLAQGNRLLFHSAEIPITIEEIQVFFDEVEKIGVDVCINDQSGAQNSIEKMRLAHIGNTLLNVTAGYHKQPNSSLLIPPFVMKRSIFSTFNRSSLQSLGESHMKLLESGHHIIAPLSISANRYIEKNEERIIASVIKGFSYWINKTGARGNYSDGGRSRNLLEEQPLYLKKEFGAHVKMDGEYLIVPSQSIDIRLAIKHP